MKKMNIPSAGPSVAKADIQAIRQAAEDGWYENMSKYLDLFSKELCSLTGRKYCLPVSHGTAALHLSMLALGIGPKDEVIVPDATWVASAACVKYVGAKIRFADMDPETWCISPKSVKKLITKKTKAVIAVNLFGNMAAMDQLQKICKKYKIALVEDAAESLGSTFNKQPSGSFGAISIMSFNATKLAMAGQGGALLTDDPEIYKKALLYSAHGIDKSINNRYYWSHVLGYNYRWTNLQAAFGLSQLKRLPELLSFKRKAYNWYKKYLGNNPYIKLNSPAKNTTSSYWLAVAELSGPYTIAKEKIEEAMKPLGIDIRPFFYPISAMAPYKGDVKGLKMESENPVTYKNSEHIICLPSSFRLTEKEVKRVCKCLLETLQRISGA